MLGQEALTLTYNLIRARQTIPFELDNPNLIRPHFLRLVSFTLQRENSEVIKEGLDLNLPRLLE